MSGEVHFETPTPVQNRLPEGEIALVNEWSGREDSNLRPLPPEDSALPG